jgi:hypothetical protein
VALGGFDDDDAALDWLFSAWLVACGILDKAVQRQPDLAIGPLLVIRMDIDGLCRKLVEAAPMQTTVASSGARH